MQDEEWTAQETTDFGGGNRKLTVKGVVTVGSSAAQASLVKRVPQGYNTSILVLNLIITNPGPSSGPVGKRPVQHVEPLESQGQYADVQINLDEKPYKTLRVEQVLS